MMTREEKNRRQNLVGGARRRLLKERLFKMYGSKCACCGEANKAFLTLEHKNGNGRSEGRTQEARWKVAIRANDHSKYEILCFNCNIGRGIYGVCPHIRPPLQGMSDEEYLQTSGKGRSKYDYRSKGVHIIKSVKLTKVTNNP